jgi:1-acyl-sn-glycerol-3-phosphate acyltransferase
MMALLELQEMWVTCIIISSANMPIDFRPIARLLTRTLHPAPRVDLSAVEAFLPRLGQEGQSQGVLITVNHYSAPDFQAWWLAIIISAVLPLKIHWVVTSGWTNSGWLTGFTHWLFPRGARMLGFTPMPAMPPDPVETEQRAVAVRQVLRYARHTPQPVIGMAPEGMDMPGGVLGTLPPGAGRFMYLLSQSCPRVLPIGVWMDEGRINLKFGSPYQLEVPVRISAHACDKLVGDTVMRHIALCLPERLRRGY